jgi:hypothetical protein
VKRFLITALMGAVGLMGCGGGGDSSSGVSTPAAAAPTVTITATNQGTVTRAMIDGGQAFGQSQPFAAKDGTAAQSIGAAPMALRTGVLQSLVQRGLVAAFGSRHSASIASATRPAATSSSTASCSVSGSITTTLSDADNSQSLSSGDALTLTFNQCQDSSDDVVSGGMVFTISSVTSAAGGNVQFSGSLAFVQLSDASGTRLANIQGSVGVAAAITSASFQIALTVGANALTVTSSAPGYLDTIVYEPGMQLTVTATDGAVTQSDVTLNGSFTASSIGGRVVVATVLPLRQLGTDADPSSGQVVVTGASGTHLRVTALSATSVQLELDANGDGTYERSGVFAWDTIG